MVGGDLDAALEQYQAFEEQLRRHAPEVAASLAAPHPDPAAAVADAFPGLVLPVDLVAWWSWHDGITGPRGYGPPFGPYVNFLSLARTLARWRDMLEGARMVAEPPELPADSFWPATWMPVIGHQGFSLAVDLAPTARREGVIFKEVDVMSYSAPEIARDLTEVVNWWTILLRTGATIRQQHPSGGVLWVTDRSLVPVDLRGNPVAYSDLEGPRDPRFLPLGEV